jgi:hypothetical protein
MRVGPPGFDTTDENPRDSSENRTPRETGGAKSGAVVEAPSLSPELTRLIESWDDLPAAVRAGILAMVQASGDS